LKRVKISEIKRIGSWKWVHNAFCVKEEKEKYVHIHMLCTYICMVGYGYAYEERARIKMKAKLQERKSLILLRFFEDWITLLHILHPSSALRASFSTSLGNFDNKYFLYKRNTIVGLM
jgi:hypothetical protein